MKHFKILLFASPAITFFVLKMSLVISEVSKSGEYALSHVSGVYCLSSFRYLVELRTSGGLLERFFYNKLTLLGNEFFTYLDYLSPKLYFSGETYGLPVEPIPAVFFPFWIAGIITATKRRLYKPLLFPLAAAFYPYLVGQGCQPFTLVVVLGYIIICWYGLKTLDVAPIYKSFVLFLIGSYCIYLLGRGVWYLLL